MVKDHQRPATPADTLSLPVLPPELYNLADVRMVPDENTLPVANDENGLWQPVQYHEQWYRRRFFVSRGYS